MSLRGLVKLLGTYTSGADMHTCVARHRAGLKLTDELHHERSPRVEPTGTVTCTKPKQRQVRRDLECAPSGRNSSFGYGLTGKSTAPVPSGNSPCPRSDSGRPRRRAKIPPVVAQSQVTAPYRRYVQDHEPLLGTLGLKKNFNKLSWNRASLGGRGNFQHCIHRPPALESVVFGLGKRLN